MLFSCWGAHVCLSDLCWEIRLLIVGGLSVVIVAGWGFYRSRHPTQSDDSTLNRRGEQYVGRVFFLAEAITNGRGTVKVGDSLWRADGPDLPAGARVRVTGLAGTAIGRASCRERGCPQL